MVDRFDQNGHAGTMDLNPYGDWVLYDDYSILQNELDDLKEEMKRIKDKITDIWFMV